MREKFVYDAEIGDNTKFVYAPKMEQNAKFVYAGAVRRHFNSHAQVLEGG